MAAGHVSDAIQTAGGALIQTAGGALRVGGGVIVAGALLPAQGIKKVFNKIHGKVAENHRKE